MRIAYVVGDDDPKDPDPDLDIPFVKDAANQLKIELDFLSNLDLDLGFDATITGFSIPEMDLIINPEAIENTKAGIDDEKDFFNRVANF